MVLRLVTAPDGLLWALTINTAGQCIGCAIDDGKIADRRVLPPLEHLPPWQARSDPDRGLWIGRDKELTCVIGDEQTIDLSEHLRKNEKVETFVILPDGFVVATSEQGTNGPEKPHVLRLTAAGDCVWTQSLPPTRVDHEEVVEMTGQSGWKSEPSPAWQPESWETIGTDALVVSGDLLLASYFEYRSGIGRHYCLSLDSGHFQWISSPSPTGYVATTAPGQFLIGRQGYGTFASLLRDSSHETLDKWKSHGMVVTQPDGNIGVVEMENVLPSRMRVARYEPGGEVVHGDPLTGYPTTHPVLSEDGRMAFFRDGRLLIANQDLTLTTVLEERGARELLVIGRTLLQDDGTVAFTVADEVWLVDTDLAPMAQTAWPCGSGNPGGNPVLSSSD
jgi:hypothetical protein